MYDISAQIINYNTKPYLRVCIDTLLADLTDVTFSYIINVLDNASSDDLKDFEYLYREKPVRFHYSTKNLGFGGGHNYLSGLTESKYILILNSDIKFIEAKSVERLYKKIYNTNYKVTGPALVLENMEQQEFDHGELYGIKAWLKNSYAASYWKKRTEPAEAAWIAGTVFLTEKQIFERAGRFDENFFLYKEEEDLCLRIRQLGAKILYNPEVRVLHYGHVVARRDKHFTNSMNYYIKKHFQKKLSYKLLNFIKIIKDYIIYGKRKERV